MNKKDNFSDRVLKFHDELKCLSVEVPQPFKLINPYNGKNKNLVYQLTHSFYKKYYADNHQRRLILGSSPARRGTAITGIPFEPIEALQKKTNILNRSFHVNKSSSAFLDEIIEKYGGRVKFYKSFYLSFVCPLGLSKVNAKGHEVNCNYYENKKLEQSLIPFIIASLTKQIEFGIDTCVCYCIGSGKNYQILTDINKREHFFTKITPLEHPRFITQYHPQDKDMYLQKYLKALSQ